MDMPPRGVLVNLHIDRSKILFCFLFNLLRLFMFDLLLRDYIIPIAFVGFAVAFAFCSITMLVWVLFDTFGDSRRKKRD